MQHRLTPSFATSSVFSLGQSSFSKGTVNNTTLFAQQTSPGRRDQLFNEQRLGRPFSEPMANPTHRATISACIEQPSWKTLPIDVDFAKDEQLEILEDNLADAIFREDAEVESQLRAKLLRLQSGAFVSVLSANFKFYRIFNARSIVDMAGIWYQAPETTCKHPISPIARGYIEVLNTFGYLFSQKLAEVRVNNCRIVVRGTVAYVTCDEVMYDDQTSQEVTFYATNVFVKHNGQWYIIHHGSLPHMNALET